MGNLVDKEKRQPTLCTLQKGSEETGIPYASLRRLVIDGHLPRVRLGDSRRTWIKRSDLQRLIDQSTE